MAKKVDGEELLLHNHRYSHSSKLQGTNRIEVADCPSSPCLSWGKHKHRRFISSVDLDSPVSELVKEQTLKVAAAEEDLTAATTGGLPWKMRNINGSAKEEEEKRSGAKSKRMQSKMAKESKSRGLELTLSKSEIEEDFLKMLGKKPPSRPKKRPKAVQKQVDFVFPGLCLPKVPAAHIYDVPKSNAAKRSKKKRAS